MKVTVHGEYAAKSPIVGRRSIKDYVETLEVDDQPKGLVLSQLKSKVLPEVLKSKDSDFVFVRTCYLSKESEKLLRVAPEIKKGTHPAQNFDPKTGKPRTDEDFEEAIDTTPVPDVEMEQMPEPKRRGRRPKVG